MVYWDRITLKDRAKFVLRNTYWMTFLALIIVMVLGGSVDSSGLGGSVGLGGSLSSMVFGAAALEWMGYGFFNWVLSLFAILLILAATIGTAYSIFVGNLLEVGKCRYLTMCRYGEINLGELFFAFRNGRYWNTVKIMFMRMLYVFLWSLLLIFPGVIKTFEYWMVPYIVAENPGISKDRAFEISKAATYGEKWNMFVLWLSFLGWRILGIFAFGIGVYFVNPYIEATNAELYGALRYKAVVSGICRPDEIGRELFEQLPQPEKNV